MTIAPPSRLALRISAVAGCLWLAAAASADPVELLRQMYDGIRMKERGGRVHMLYGAPMSPGLTAEAAAEKFWEDHGDIFRGRQPELERRWAATPRESNKTIIAYHQTIRGTPVEGANARVMVTSRAGVNRVSFVSAQLAGEPTIGTEIPIVPPQLASIFVQSRPEYGTLSIVGEPERVVLLGWGERGDAWAWKVRTVQTDVPFGEPRTFFISTSELSVLHVRNDRAAAQSGNQVNVTVQGKALSNHEPHTTSNTPVWTNLPYVRVEWSEVGQGVWNEEFTDDSGFTSFDVGSLTQVDVRSTLGQTTGEGGLRVVTMDYEDEDDVQVNPYAQAWCGWEYGLSAGATASQSYAPGTLTLQYASTHEFDVAQANVVYHISRSYDYLLGLWGSDPGFLSQPLRVAVNMAGNNFGSKAFYHACSSADSVATLGFGAAGRGTWFTGYRNMAYSSVIVHEYGHHILHQLIENPFGAFSEGFADSFWIIMSGDPIIGRNWHVNETFIRNPGSSGCEYGNIYQTGCECILVA